MIEDRERVKEELTKVLAVTGYDSGLKLIEDVRAGRVVGNDYSHEDAKLGYEGCLIGLPAMHAGLVPLDRRGPYTMHGFHRLVGLDYDSVNRLDELAYDLARSKHHPTQCPGLEAEFIELVQEVLAELKEVAV